MLTGDVVADADLQVETFADDIHHAVEQVQTDFQGRIALCQQRQGRRHVIATEAEAAAQVQAAAGAVVGFGQFVAELLKVFEDAHGPALHPLAVLGQGDTSAGAVQQAGSEGGFEYLDTLADIGRRQPQFIGGGSEAGLADDGEEHAKVFGQGHGVFLWGHGRGNAHWRQEPPE